MRATRLLAVLSVAAVLAACGSGGSKTAGTLTNAAPKRLEVFSGGRLLGSAVQGKAGRLNLPRRLTLRRGRARLVVELAPRSAPREIAHALRLHEPRLALKVAPLRS